VNEKRLVDEKRSLLRTGLNYCEVTKLGFGDDDDDNDDDEQEDTYVSVDYLLDYCPSTYVDTLLSPVYSP
jgi:hypothetical protein